MKPTDRQRLVMGFVATNGDITLKDAVNLIGGHYYANAHRHTGATLQRMVNRGLLVRVKPGVFQAAPPINFLPVATFSLTPS